MINYLRRAILALLAFSLGVCLGYAPTAFAQAQTPITPPNVIQYDFGISGGGGDTKQEKAILFVSDSWMHAAAYDEPWAHYYMGGTYRPAFAGFQARMYGLLGGTIPVVASGRNGGLFTAPPGAVYAANARTTGGAFGANADFDLLRFLKLRKEISDVVLLLGTNDMNVSNCSHGTPFNAAIEGTTTCSVTDTTNNLIYLFDQIMALGVKVHWQVPPAWLGLWDNQNNPGQATMASFITDVYASLIAHCSGKTCYPSKAWYVELCAGYNAAADPAGGSDCTALNLYDTGDGAGFVNKQNRIFAYVEDTLIRDRTGGVGVGTLQRHVSGWGYQRLFNVLLASMKAADPTLATRFASFNTDFTKIPAIPDITLSNVTATSIDVTVNHGTYVNGSTAGLGTNECGPGGDCYFACWATCRENVLDSADPSCWDGAETPQVRQYGAPSGASHRTEDGTNTLTSRQFVMLSAGQTGKLVNLSTLTTYHVACVSVSPTAISHPAIRVQVTP